MGTQIQNTFFIINYVTSSTFHPLFDDETAQKKLNALGKYAQACGDSWFKTVVRIITPNTFHYSAGSFNYFYQRYVISNIFIAGARTMVITTASKNCTLLISTKFSFSPLYQPTLSQSYLFIISTSK